MYIVSETPSDPAAVRDADFDAEAASGVCSSCQMADRLADIAAIDREAIRAAASRGTVSAVIEARKRLGWSIKEAVLAVEMLRDQA